MKIVRDAYPCPPTERDGVVYRLELSLAIAQAITKAVEEEREASYRDICTGCQNGEAVAFDHDRDFWAHTDGIECEAFAIRDRAQKEGEDSNGE